MGVNARASQLWTAPAGARVPQHACVWGWGALRTLASCHWQHTEPAQGATRAPRLPAYTSAGCRGVSGPGQRVLRSLQNFFLQMELGSNSAPSILSFAFSWFHWVYGEIEEETELLNLPKLHGLILGQILTLEEWDAPTTFSRDAHLHTCRYVTFSFRGSCTLQRSQGRIRAKKEDGENDARTFSNAEPPCFVHPGAMLTGISSPAA